jgi:hypothetical protein
MENYLSDLLSQLKDVRVRTNFKDLVDKIIEAHSIQVWKMSHDADEFNRFRDLLNGSLKNGISLGKLQSSQLKNFNATLNGKSYVVVVHDGSDIRKPNAEKMENIGWVKSLTGDLVRGYSTLNSIAVFIKEGDVRLLRCTPYSNKEPSFISKKEMKHYETGQIKDPLRRKEIEDLLEKEQEFNTDSLIRKHIKEIHQSIKAENPDCLIVHVLDRGYDSENLFAYIDELGDFFVIRMNRKRLSEKTEGNMAQKPLIEMEFEDEYSHLFKQIGYEDKKYENVEVKYQWGCWKKYDILKVRLKHLPSGKLIGKEPLLLVTNLQISSPLLAILVFQYYLNRWKIESLFRFLKQVLGWEEFLIRDWESIKNLISLAFFVGGYFYEIDDDLIKDERIEWLAELGGGKGKVSRSYVMRGIAELIKTQNTLDFLVKNKITPQQIQQVLERFTSKKTTNSLIISALQNK